MTDTKKTGRLRWKKHPAETGLRAIGAGPRGSDYTDGVTAWATVYAHSFRHTGKRGWYWVSRAGGLYVNTCNVEGLTEEQAKAQSQAHVKAALAAKEQAR